MNNKDDFAAGYVIGERDAEERAFGGGGGGGNGITFIMAVLFLPAIPALVLSYMNDWFDWLWEMFLIPNIIILIVLTLGIHNLRYYKACYSESDKTKKLSRTLMLLSIVFGYFVCAVLFELESIHKYGESHLDRMNSDGVGHGFIFLGLYYLANFIQAAIVPAIQFFLIRIFKDKFIYKKIQSFIQKYETK
ncbi:hypothetical protein [Bacillus sp. FJAT-29937]|uniref:hypothetical protein n=1 Tax=Bacillus sp. FJAT-29937 TaxID=1720553 RepID=UPI000830566C|nr:hypothetical protein [Bacillus sp. FJAT-29937]